MLSSRNRFWLVAVEPRQVRCRPPPLNRRRHGYLRPLYKSNRRSERSILFCHYNWAGRATAQYSDNWRHLGVVPASCVYVLYKCLPCVAVSGNYPYLYVACSTARRRRPTHIYVHGLFSNSQHTPSICKCIHISVIFFCEWLVNVMAMASLLFSLRLLPKPKWLVLSRKTV